jgi:hypothetical protein
MDKLHALFPPLRAKAISILDELEIYLDKHHKHLKLTPFITEGFRTASYQYNLWKKGRFPTRVNGKMVWEKKVTNLDGYIKKSNHQSSMAWDIGFLTESKKLTYNVPSDVWDYYGHLVRKHNLVWGGDWKSLVDKPHAEWRTADKATYKEAQKWQKENGLK